MGKPNNKRNGKNKNGGIVKLMIVVEKLQKSLSLRKNSSRHDDDDDVYVPEDVKEGHFAVIANAMKNDEEEEEEEKEVMMKRFVIPLSYLTHPTFLRLLEQAAEEYGFDREGALTIPCRPSELQKILSSSEERDSSSRVNAAGYWDSRNKTMVQSF